MTLLQLKYNNQSFVTSSFLSESLCRAWLAWNGVKYIPELNSWEKNGTILNISIIDGVPGDSTIIEEILAKI